MADGVLNLVEARRGHFRYESGFHGELWLDLDGLFAEPARLGPLTAELAARLAPHAPEVVCGPLSGGAFLAYGVAGILGAGFAWTERSVAGEVVRYELPARLHDLVRGRRVAVVDDVVNAGSATGATLAALVDAGAVPVALGALLTLGDGAARLAAAHGIPLEPLAHEPFTRWPADACPRCAAGIPLDLP